MRYFFKKIQYGIKNLITWFPVIWNDRQWDHIYFLMIVQKKLKLMESSFRKYGHHVGSEKDANKIHYAYLLTKRLIDDNYMENAFKRHTELFGELFMKFDDKTHRVHINYVKANTPKEIQACNNLFDKCCKHEDYLKNQDLNLLLLHFKKHLTKWWD
jgi:hypothetical protein